MEERSILPLSPREIFTVTELTLQIKGLLEESFQSLWVEGEISNLRLHRSGHLYLTLKDERSQIRAVMFRSQVRLMAFEPEDGMHVLCRGRIGVYEVRGEYQIILDFMEPRGLGALQQAFEKLKARLHEEGLFDAARKRPLPLLPRHIGIITSPTGAAIRDMLQILHRRFPGLHILIRPVKVQGEGAAEEIVEALDDLNRVEGLDLIVVTRGGGSLEDLWAFNEEAVARAIARSHLPVVSGVGHEIDFTIADFVADVRAPTPSAAAELIVPLRKDLEDALRQLHEGLARTVARTLRERKMALADLAQRLKDPRRRIADQRLLLDDLQGRLIAVTGRSLHRSREILQQQGERLLLTEPRGRARRERPEVMGLRDRLMRSITIVLQTGRSHLEREMVLLNSLSPVNVLGRGYSITRRLPAGEIVREARFLHSGDRLRITFHEGETTARVEGTEHTKSAQRPKS